MRAVHYRPLFCLFFIFATLAASPVDVDVSHYGQLPFMRSVAISPDGRHIAYIQRGNEGDFFVIADATTNEILGGGDARNIKARSIYFATNQHVILVGSDTHRAWGVIGKWENSGSLVYDLKTREMIQLLRRTEDLYQAQSGLGRIVGLNKERETVYMPAFVGRRGNPAYHLLAVNLTSGRGQVVARGKPQTTDWFVDGEGNVLAKEEYHESDREHRVFARHNDGWKRIYTNETSVPEISIGAVSADGQSLVFRQEHNGYDAIFKMALADGTISGPLFAEQKREIDLLLTRGMNREFEGVLFAGLLPNYLYLDKVMQAHTAAIQGQYPESAVHALSATHDLSKIVYKVSGNQAADDYLIFNTDERKILVIGSGYPEVAKDQIANVTAIKYEARDGLPVYAVVTWPVGVEDRSDLPMLVLPHGGPESYDSIRFDWWAQYFARQGYVVLQPNFRGSTGFGSEFRKAGHGGWGTVMQDDISDGVQKMTNAGYVDPRRVCIMGASYGGYAALAGGAFTPELYRCIVSVAGVADLPRMMRDVKSRRGYRHWAVSYWQDLIGGSKAEQEKLKDISPVNFAANFTAPVLLLHGKDDTVVPLAQSKRMARALEKAGKHAELVVLKGEDHWLSNSDTRLQLLTNIAAFLQTHNPVESE